MENNAISHYSRKTKPPDIVITDMTRRMLDLYHEPYYIKNLESRFVYANMALARLVSLRSPDAIVGRLDNEIQSKLCENEETVKEWRAQDQSVITSLKCLAALEIHRGAADHPFVARKMPLYNDRNECIGVACYARNLEVFTLNDLLKARPASSLLLDKPDDYFTERECEIIFLKLQAMSNKQVGQILNLATKTIDNRLNRLYNKAGVNHFDDFFEFCRRRRYHCYLPAKFISSKIININKQPIDYYQC